MPLKKAPKKAKKSTRRKIAAANIREMHTGSTYARTMRKFGKKKANAQAVAVGLRTAGLSRKKKKKSKKR
jgi:hypothetical protein